MDFYQILFRQGLDHNFKLDWYFQLFAKYLKEGMKLFAKYKKVKGNTLVWNQKYQITISDKTQTLNSVTLTDNRDGSYTVVTDSNGATDDTVFGLRNSITIGKQHKVLLAGIPSGASLSTAYITNGWSGMSYTTNSVFTITTGSGNMSIEIRVANGAVITTPLVFKPQIFDLTVMGYDSLTADQFCKLFSLPYYENNKGFLLSFTGTGIKVTNADQTIESTLLLPISTYFPTGMKSAGSGTNRVYDELTEEKAITRVGTRAYASGDESDTTVTTDGTNTNYALTTPTEQSVSLDLKYRIEDGWTEQLLPVNTSTPTTSPILADIDYGAEQRTDEEFTYRVWHPSQVLMSMALNTLLGRNVSTNQTEEALNIIMKGE